jgi:hypothetical protein
MKATVFSVFKVKSRKISYQYHNVEKNNDDVHAVTKHIFYTPMMEIKFWKEKFNPLTESPLEFDSHKVFATPEVIEKYTGFDLFEAPYYYYFDGRVLDIEFEWEEKEYPYIRTYHYKDYIRTDKYKLPIISKIEEPKFDW